MKKLLLTVFTLSSFGALHAQITLTNTDMAAPGDTIFQIIDQNPLPSISPGSGGANQFYDMADLTVNTDEALLFKTPSATPYAASFPNATMALRYADFDVFFKNNSTGLYVEGSAGTYFGYSGIVLKNNPVEQLLKFPMTFNTSFVSVSKFKHDQDTNITFSGINADSIRIKETKTKTVVADGWGSIKTPFDSLACLRVHETGATVDSVFVHAFGQWFLAPSTGGFNNPSTTPIDHYGYWTKTTNYPIVELDLDTNGNVVNVMYLKTRQDFTSIKEVSSLVAGMHPNPANDVVNVSFSNDKAKAIQIYNSIGMLVMSDVVTGFNNTINVSGLAKGIYSIKVMQDIKAASVSKLIIE